MTSGPPRPFISVKFTPAGRTQTFLLPDLALDGPDQTSPSPAGPPAVGPGDAVIVQTAEGPAVATVTRGIPQLDDRRRPASDASTIVVRKATRGDIVARLKHQQREQEAQRICLLKIRERGLAMKLARVEQLFDGSRLIFYYTAEGRVDFRELVRDLAAHFRIRIEMRQIGVRDEAKMLGGYGSVRAAALLHDVAADLRADLDQDGEATEPEPEPVQAVGDVRKAQVLPAIRAPERQGCGPRRLRRRRRLRKLRQPDRPGVDRVWLVWQRRLRQVRLMRRRSRRRLQPRA